MKTILMKPYFYPVFITLLFITLHSPAKAQTFCTGETIIAHESFGTNEAQPLIEGRTSFKPMSGSEVAEGEYILSSSSRMRADWHESPDHSGNTDGQMMLVSPGSSDGEFYTDTLDNLQTGTYYSLSMYVMNVNLPGSCGGSAVLPQLKIEIGYYSAFRVFNHLATLTTAPIAESAIPAWTKISCGFIMPAGISSVSYRIVNEALGSCGNSLAIDDISFSSCSGLSTLPVTGLKINSIEKNGNAATIIFSTESEYQTSGMDAQKSSDGINWQTFNSQSAAGNSDRRKSYMAQDLRPYALTYYRIRQTDQKGDVSYSAIVRYTTQSTGVTMSTYPTPFTSQLLINFSSEKNDVFTVTLYESSGRLLQTTTVNARIGINNVQFSTGNLKQGQYLVQLVNRDGSIRISRQTVRL